MAGISHVLSIAKEALLTHQMSIQVASNNISNVDTPGYTRQTLALSTNPSTPVAAGNLGGGVRGAAIARNYDQFMVKRLIDQQSTMGNLEAQQGSMRLIESVFNEAPGLAINDLLSQFWSSWQTLSNNPELSASRQSVVQAGQLMVDQLHAMSAEMSQAKYDIGVSLNTGISDVNSIVKQIATLNGQISAAESAGHTSNDLRDNRDKLLGDLSGLLNISSFEDSSGSTTVLLADGHTLVANVESWQVDWENNELIWVNQDSNGAETRKSLGSSTELGGKVGGWLAMHANVDEGDPNNFLGRINDFAKSMIREINQQHSQGVGMVLFGDTTTGTEQASKVARLTTPVDPSTATTTIPANTMTINNRSVGEILGGATNNGLGMSKAANAVDAINTAEAGVEARLTTLMAGSALTTTNFAANDVLSFTVNDVTIDYTVQAGDLGVGNEDVFAAHLAAEVNSDMTIYNTLTTTTNPVTILAKAGDGSNGGVANSIVFYNQNEGDESAIIVDNLGINPLGGGTATTTELGLDTIAGVSQRADSTHNTGEITLFSKSSFTVEAGSNDLYLAQLGMGGGNATTTFYDGGAVSAAPANTDISFNLNGTAINVSVLALDTPATIVTTLQAAITAAGEPVTVSLVNGNIRFENSVSGNNSPITVDSFTWSNDPIGDPTIFGFGNFTAQVGGVNGDATTNDGKFTFNYEDGPAGTLLIGYDYFDELNTDNGSFDMWIYNNDGSLAMPDPVTVSLERVYSLDELVNVINQTVATATNGSGWVTASNSLNSLRLTPDASHQIAFANDTSNILQVAGLNTFFSGSDAASINVNTMVSSDLNLLAAAKVTQNGEVYRGDNTNALAVSELQSNEYIHYTGGKQATLDGFYNSLVGDVANSSRTVTRAYDFNTLVQNQMNEMRDSVSGVSLDEEMASLVKYQQAYTAAARLISMSDEMLTTLLDTVR